MDKELAEKILELSTEANRIDNEKYEISRGMKLSLWSDVQTEALKFLLGVDHGK